MKQLKSEEAIAQSLRSIDRAFRGSLVIKATDSLKWKLYFRLGRLSWVTGGRNYQERLLRHLALFCPQITATKLEQIASELKPDREPAVLIKLQGEKLIQRQQIAALMESIAIEVLFDVFQYGETTSDELTFEKVAGGSNYSLILLLPFLEVETIFRQAWLAWHEWQNIGLGDYSPNSYPVIKQSLALQKLLTYGTEQQVTRLVDGTQTLRAIAIKSQKDLVDLTRFLVSLVDSGGIEFSSVPQQKRFESWQSNSTSKITDKPKTAASSQNSPLIVCVDDSPLICRAMEKIILSQDYRFIGIQEPLKVVPTLLRDKPDFIFLDLMMPVVNGYELCAQLRRTPSLKDVPIVIVTGKDGLVDRMRAKLVGSTDFIAKPVAPDAVLKMLEKHLTVRR